MGALFVGRKSAGYALLLRLALASVTVACAAPRRRPPAGPLEPLPTVDAAA